MRKLILATLFFALTLGTSVHTAELKESFTYGINYAWKNYAGDFGGIAAWGKPGVAASPEEFRKELLDMASNGIEVVRWWLWPEFWTDAITFDADGAPNQLGQQAIDDALMALQLADEAGLRVMLCFFSFDGFRPSRESFGITMTGYHDIVIDDNKRSKLMSNVVEPLVTALAASPHLDALHSWDVINEPEWAVTGENKYGGNNFEPSAGLEPVTHDQMEVFINDTIKILRTITPDIPITIGSAAAKWLNAWEGSDYDFYQPHIYDWVNEYWPYTASPSDLGFDDKPMIMGEYPLEGLSVADAATMQESWLNNGYAGALGWDYRITHASGESEDEKAVHRQEYLAELKRFAAEHNVAGSDTQTTGEVAEPPTAAAQPKKLPLSAPATPAIEIDQ